MAVGDVTSSLTSVANDAYLDIQPASGIEWVIHNLYHAGSAELYISDGTNEIKVMSDTTESGWLGYYLHANNDRYYRIKNISGGSIYLGYDGVITK